MTPLIIESTSYHRKHLLSSKGPLLIESTKHHGTSCHRKHLLSSRVPLIIGKTSSYRKDLLLSKAPLVIESTSCYRKAFLSDRERHRGGLSLRPAASLEVVPACGLRRETPLTEWCQRTGPYAAMRMRNVTILKFHGGWAVQTDFLFDIVLFEENRSVLPFQINLTIIYQRKSCEEFRRTG